MNLAAEGWGRLWQALGASRADYGLMNQLLAAYSEAHRRYHTLQHLRECLAHCDAAAGLARHPERVELAVWFHDAVYDPRRSDNEARSAEWARASLLAAGCGGEVAQQVHALVLATAHGAGEPAAADADTDLLLDIDLAILGAAPARFDEYEAQVRAEYPHGPEAEFRSGRARLLQGFLDRPRIYRTGPYRAALEERARGNLRRSVERLAD